MQTFTNHTIRKAVANVHAQCRQPPLQRFLGPLHYALPIDILFSATVSSSNTASIHNLVSSFKCPLTNLGATHDVDVVLKCLSNDYPRQCRKRLMQCLCCKTQCPSWTDNRCCMYECWKMIMCVFRKPSCPLLSILSLELSL